jgi:hypothetical protein
MTELVPWVRILLYIVAGYLLNKGLPPQAASIITDDPLVLEAVSNFLAGAITILTVMWWRLAKRFGWAT